MIQSRPVILPQSSILPRPRILLLNEFGSLNGGERSLLAVLELLKGDYEFVAAVPEQSSLARTLSDIEIEVLPLQIENSGVRNTSESIDQHLQALVESSSVDLIHANSLSMSRHLGRIADRLSIPKTGHCRDMYGMSRKAVADLNSLDRIIFVSQAAMDFHVARGVDANRSHVIHNGVDLHRFQPRPATGFLRSELKIPTDARMLLSIGQIGIRKGLDFLFDAFEIVCEQESNARLLVIGNRYSQKDEAVEFERDLQQRAARTPLSGRVHFLGLRDDIPQIMNEVDLLVHAARQEPLGRVLLEACASGLPSVATNVGGTREIFPTNCDAAILVEQDVPQQFAAAMIKVMRDDSLLSTMSISVRNRAAEAFDRNTSAKRLAKLWSDELR